MSMTFEDIASAENFIGSVERISETFALIHEESKPPKQELKQARFRVGDIEQARFIVGNDEPVAFSEENGTI